MEGAGLLGTLRKATGVAHPAILKQRLMMLLMRAGCEADSAAAESCALWAAALSLSASLPQLHRTSQVMTWRLPLADTGACSSRVRTIRQPKPIIDGDEFSDMVMLQLRCV